MISSARIILGLKKFDHISEGLKSLNWLSVQDSLYVKDAVMVFKCINNLVPDYLKGKFVSRSTIHCRNTRSVSNNNLQIPKYRLANGQRTFAYRGCKLWNELNPDIRETKTIWQFKKKIINSLCS